MTRETKIGLLVGLAFIIVVGILLSEHLTTTTERPMAPLAEAGHGVREGVVAPGTPGLDQPVAPRPAEPQQPVPVARELPPANPTPAPHVAVNGPSLPQTAGTPTIIVRGETPAVPVSPTDVIAQTEPAIVVAQQPEIIPTAGEPIVTRTPPVRDPFANDPIVKVAAEHGQAIVPVTDAARKPADVIPQTRAREYKAQPGDTLSRIAAMLPGGNTKANRDAIVKLNPTLQKDPNKIITGRTYLLPTSGATATGSERKAEPLVDAAKLPAPTPAKPQSADGVRIYTVKPGDTLTKIAINELGSKSEVTTIRKLNADVLKDGDLIKVDMKLKLPSKTQVAAK